jgi:hypothetical protein
MGGHSFIVAALIAAGAAYAIAPAAAHDGSRGAGTGHHFRPPQHPQMHNPQRSPSAQQQFLQRHQSEREANDWRDWRHATETGTREAREQAWREREFRMRHPHSNRFPDDRRSPVDQGFQSGPHRSRNPGPHAGIWGDGPTAGQWGNGR